MASLKKTSSIETNLHNKDKPLIYLLDEDETYSLNLSEQLTTANFNVKYFTSLNQFESACIDEEPNILIMDVYFEENKIIGSDYIGKLKLTLNIDPTLVFISSHDDFNDRLAAIRVGAVRFFNKTIASEHLIETLQGLTSQVTITPYKALIVNDENIHLTQYELMLKEAGMTVKAINQPTRCIEALTEFMPDVLILDLTQATCTNIELAQIIRQNDNLALIPILLFTSESDSESSEQLLAMKIGGDGFLIKPINPIHFISAVTAKASRSRWVIRLNNDLKKQNRENEFQLNTMNQHDIVSVADITGKITYVNDKFCKISGYSREELIGKTHFIVKSNAHPKKFYKNLWQTITSGKTWRGTICNLTKKGEHYWVESTIVPFLDSTGKPYKYVSARTDITQLKQSRERLEQSQLFANTGTWDWNITTGVLHWSDHIWTLFGYEKEITKTSYENFLNAIHVDDRESVINAVNNCVEHGTEYNIEHRVVWSDGTIRWLNESGNVTRDIDGKALHMLGVVRDITERKISEVAAQRNYQIQNVLDTILSSALNTTALNEVLQNAINVIIKSSVISTKATGSIFLSNNDAKELTLVAEYGLNEKLLISCNKVAFGTCHCGLAASTKKTQFTSCLTDKHVITYKGMQPHGHYCVPIMLRSKLLGILNIYLEDGHNPTQDERDFLDMLMNTLAMIIDRKYAEQSLVEAREEAEKANLSKSQFLSNMSHELRTPLNAILGFSQLLTMPNEQPLNDYQIENVEEISKAGSHLLTLINEVLDLASIEAGKVQLSLDSVELSDVIDESLQLVLPLAQYRNIQLNYMLNGEPINKEEILLLKQIVRADYTRLKQVILNLLSNAIKYNCEDGTIIIAITQDDKLTKISISDTGKGLTPSEIDDLFKAFNRLGAEQTDIEGTGIGLVISKNLIELMDGEIGVQSKINEGCDFWIKIPNEIYLAKKEKITNYKSADLPIVIKQTDYKYKVLYIEDNPANLRLITQLLSRESMIDVYSAHEPYLGLELAYEHQPDLILLDINLPGINGYEVLKKLKQKPQTANIPVIAISANAMPKDIEKGLSSGFVHYITKPINVRELLNSVNLTLTTKTKSIYLQVGDHE
jgi:PAS domain S-box-containing protein